MQVAVGGGEGKNGKKKKKKDERKPSEAERPPSPEPAAAGGGSWDPNDDDRWGSECFKCGHDGDLLCCEVRPDLHWVNSHSMITLGR